MTDHHIVEGDERNGYCDRCGLGGDLTLFSYKEHQKTRAKIEAKLDKLSCFVCKKNIEGKPKVTIVTSNGNHVFCSRKCANEYTKAIWRMKL